MASHRRPKQPSRTRVTVLTTAAAAAVALSSQAANAAPSEKPSKDEVKAKVDKLYEDAEQATEKLNGAKEKQEKLEKEISTIQDNVARGQEDLNELRDGHRPGGQRPVPHRRHRLLRPALPLRRPGRLPGQGRPRSTS